MEEEKEEDWAGEVGGTHGGQREDGKIRQVALIRTKYVRGLRYRPVGWGQRLAALEL